MKIVTGNRLNEFWDELKGVFVPKSKVLKTMEEIEANTNEENVAGATALKAVNNNLMSMTDNGMIKGIDVREDGVYIIYVPTDGADTVSKKLGNPDPSSSRFRYYTTSPGGSNTYYLPDGIYVYFTMNGGGGGTTVNGSTWQANFPTNSLNFQYGKYGIVDTSKSNVVSQRVNASDHTATALFYKISD